MTVATTSPPGPRAAASTSGPMAGSTNTLMVPPQASPTSQACSWLTPKVTSFGVPRSSAARDLAGGGALHAAAGHRPRDGAARCRQHRGAFGLRGRAPDAGHHRPAERSPAAVSRW